MYDVFISYVDGQPIALQMKRALEEQGLRVFMDKEMLIGSTLVASINRAMKESRGYLLIIDQDFTKRGWTNIETESAFLEALHQKRLFPLLIDNTAKDYWIKENPLFANYLGRTWEESTPEALACEIAKVLKTTANPES